ncbi:plastid-specific ribosomal protein 6 [Dorcoceras hygrometricum]|uniref:Plastid-specific ribosomal protein 6 n=1 Tax=Dorcoceras hygrometricum TaxID=472368 RepID=A0A2Z7BWL8_9LAMI|nr:plastid-specific ribosomal protein 6 [Dorcoceras hygrometricum]
MGPISNISPKTSRAARDRPELNPRINQPSRHRRSITGRRPHGGGRCQDIARGLAASCAAQPRNAMRDQHISYASSSTQPCTIIGRPASDSSATIALDSGQPCATTAREATATNRQPCATSAQAIARLRALLREHGGAAAADLKNFLYSI